MKISGLASEILGYLDVHPHAVDSVEGIAAWWLSSHYEPTEIKRTLDALAEQGLVERIPLRDGSFAYGRLAGSPSHRGRARLVRTGH